MIEQTNGENNFNVRGVNISDLKSIIDIHHKNETNKNDVTSKEPLTEAFGLPLHLVEYNKKVIAYSFVSVNDNEEAKIQLLISDGFKTMGVNEMLTQVTVNPDHFCLSENKTDCYDSVSILNAVRKLIHWLNQCSQ